MVLQRSGASSASFGTPTAKNKSGGKILDSPQDAGFQDQFCPWVRAAPTFSAAGHLAKVYRTSLQRLTQYLIDHLEDILPTWFSVEHGSFKAGAGDSDAWSRTVCNTNRLPKYWLAKFLSETDMSDEPLSQALVKKIDDSDSTAIPRLFTFGLQLPESAPLPKQMRSSKLLCWKVFQKRMAEVGSPLKDFAKNYVNKTTGAIDWSGGGCYTFVWGEDGNATSIKYLGGADTTVSVLVGRDYEMINPWDAAGALIMKKPSKMLCCEFFAEGTGPHTVIDKKGKQLERLAEEVGREIEAALSDLKREEAAPGESEFVGDNLKDERAKRLQEAQTRARDSAKRRRRVAIT